MSQDTERSKNTDTAARRSETVPVPDGQHKNLTEPPAGAIMGENESDFGEDKD